MFAEYDRVGQERVVADGDLDGHHVTAAGGIGETGLDADDVGQPDEWRVRNYDAVVGECHVRQGHDLIHDRFVGHEIDRERRLIFGGRLVRGGNAGEIDVVRSREVQRTRVFIHYAYEGGWTPTDNAHEQL